MTTVISDYYDYFVDTLNHTESLKLKDSPGENVANFCDAILVDVGSLESAVAFKPKHIGYIICIFEDDFDSRFHLWATQKYKEVMEFVIFFCV